MATLPVEVPSCHDDDDDVDENNDDVDDDVDVDDNDDDDNVDDDKNKLQQPAIGCKAEVMGGGYRVWT